MAHAKQQPHKADEQPFTREEEDAIMDELIHEALDCPCVKDLREGPCGKAFEAAFTCFHKSREVPKGYECMEVNTVFAACLSTHPSAVEGLKQAQAEGLFPEPPAKHQTQTAHH